MNMTKISNFDVTGNVVSWSLGDERIRIPYTNLEHAVVNENQGYVLVLLKGEELPEKLIVLDSAGKEIENITSIDNFKLYYLSSHPKTEVSIVCISNSPVEHFTDWHFGYDIKHHQFVRLNRAY